MAVTAEMIQACSSATAQRDKSSTHRNWRRPKSATTKRYGVSLCSPDSDDLVLGRGKLGGKCDRLCSGQ